MKWYISIFILNLYIQFVKSSEMLNNSQEHKNQMYEMSLGYNMKQYKINPPHLWFKPNNSSTRNTNKCRPNIPNTSMIIRAYVGSVSRLPCHLRVSPVEETKVVWMYTESLSNLSFNIVEEKETYVINAELTLYYTTREDEGVYQCQLGKSYGGLILLEATDEENYTVIICNREETHVYNCRSLVKVKPSSAYGPHASRPEALSRSLITFTVWSPWSECSRCDKVGRRRRYGVCYVALIDFQISSEPKCTSSKPVDDKIFRQLRAYRKGVPCRSPMLPAQIGDLPEVQSRQNQIMIGMCKVPCKRRIFEIRSESGKVVERANNTAGIYSLYQKKPLQPPQIAREAIFVLPEAKISIRCPGTILRDIPATWRIGNKLVVPRQLEATTGGRIRLNARDHIVYENVKYADTNVYSCWQDDVLAGVVKLEVSQSAQEIYRNRLIMVAVIVALILLIRYTTHISRYSQREFCKK